MKKVPEVHEEFISDSVYSTGVPIGCRDDELSGKSSPFFENIDQRIVEKKVPLRGCLGSPERHAKIRLWDTRAT
jgi:hypothetical protein